MRTYHQGVERAKLLKERSHSFVETDYVLCVYVTQFPHLQNKNVFPCQSGTKTLDLRNSINISSRTRLSVGSRIPAHVFASCGNASSCFLSCACAPHGSELAGKSYIFLSLYNYLFSLDLIIILCICYIFYGLITNSSPNSSSICFNAVSIFTNFIFLKMLLREPSDFSKWTCGPGW